MSTETLGVGIIGCGGTGRSHANAYRAHDRTEIVAAAERVEETREAFQSDYDVGRTYAEHGEMLAEESLDVVSVCTFHDTHARLAVDAVEGGADAVVCEKPMATSLGDAQDMLDAADRNDALLTVSHQRRYHPVHEKARELVADGAIGEPTVVTARYRDGLLNWGTHLIDLSRYVLGDPGTEWVIGQLERTTDRHERGQPIEDCCLAQVCFETGARLTLEMDLPGPAVEDNRIQVYGTRGRIDIEVDSGLTVRNGDGETEYTPAVETPERVAYLDELVEALAGDGVSHRCRGRQAGHTVEIMMSLYESVRTTGPVETPLRTRVNPLEAMIEAGDLPVEHPGKYDIRLPYAGLDD